MFGVPDARGRAAGSSRWVQVVGGVTLGQVVGGEPKKRQAYRDLPSPESNIQGVPGEEEGRPWHRDAQIGVGSLRAT